MKSPRRILLVGAAILVLLVAAIAIAAALIPGERVARAVAARAEAVLGQPVRIEDVGLRILPLPGVRLSGLAVGEDSAELARVDDVELRARILPLFRGRVVVSRLALERPRVLLEIDSAGTLNLPLMQGDTAGGAGRDITFAVDGIEVESGRIGFRDLRDGTVVRLDGWNQSLRLAGTVRAGELETVTFTGSIAFEDVDARLPDVVLPVRDVRLRIEHDATLDRAADRLDVRTVEATLNGITLAGTGQVAAVSEPTRTTRLELAADGIDAAELTAWLPEGVRERLTLPDGRRVRLAGAAALEAVVDGPIAADAMPSLSGTFTLEDLGAAADEDPLLEEVDGRGSFSLDSVAASLEGRVLGETFSVELALGSPPAPVVMASLRGGVDLARLADLGMVSDTLALTGPAIMDLNVRLPVDAPARTAISGTIGIAGIRASGTEPAVAITAGTVRLDGGRLVLDPARIGLGPEAVPVVVRLTMDGWIPALMDSLAPPPTVSAAVDADTLDLDALLEPREGGYAPLFFARLRDRAVDGRSAAEAAEEQGLSLPALPPVSGDVAVSVGLLVRNGLRYRDLEARLRLGPRAVDVERLGFGLMGGTVELSGRLEPVRTDSTGRVTESRLMGQYAVASVGAGTFFDRLTPFRDHLAGSLDLVGSVDLVLDRYGLPERSTLGAAGTLALADGALANWRVLDAVGGRLQLASFDTIRFRDWVGSYAVTGPLVTLDETVLQGDRLEARAAGSFDVGGRLDLGATLFLPRELAERAGSLGREVVAAAGTDGRVPVGLRITGSVERPDVALDLSAARTAVVDRARDAAEQQARELAGRATREAAERLELPDSLRGLPADSLRTLLGDSLFTLLPDSVKLPADSLQDQAEEALKDRLRKLLRGGGGGSR